MEGAPASGAGGKRPSVIVLSVEQLLISRHITIFLQHHLEFHQTPSQFIV
jgi:hypothetical protein